MTARHLPMVVSYSAANAASEAPAGHASAWSMRLHLGLGWGFGSRHFCQGEVNV
jgi:hypothetical protein